MTLAELANGLARGTHIAATMLVFGTAIIRAGIAPPALSQSDAAARQRIQRCLARLVGYGLVVAIFAAGCWLALVAMDLSPAAGAGAYFQTVVTILLEMNFGPLLVIRLGLLAVAGLLLLRSHNLGSIRIATGLFALALGLQAGLGHGISMRGGTGIMLTLSEVLHLLAAGAWLGALPGLFILVRIVPAQAAVISVRRFSRIGVICVVVLAATILFQWTILIGGLPALIGTDYGRLALLKLALFCALLALAAINRFRLTPALGTMDGKAGAGLLGRSIAVEAGIGLVVILVAGVLLTQPPAMHTQPDWPFALRPSTAVLADSDLRAEVLMGAIELGAALAFLCFAVLYRRPWRWLGVPVAAVLGWVATPHLALLLVPAYPTSYYHSPTGFTSAAIVSGSRLFLDNCTACHGNEGRGNGPSARSLPVPPADLTADHLFAHSDGELFWWLTHGMEGPNGDLVMPGFGGALDEDDRWSLIDYIRAHNDGLAVTPQGQWLRPTRAPDATVTLDGRKVALSSLSGRTLRVIAGSEGSREPLPSLPPINDLEITTVVLAPDSDAWDAYAIISGIHPNLLQGTRFLVDSHGWLRAVFNRGAGDGHNDDAAFIAAARQAKDNPIQDGNNTVAHSHR